MALLRATACAIASTFRVDYKRSKKLLTLSKVIIQWIRKVKWDLFSNYYYTEQLSP